MTEPSPTKELGQLESSLAKPLPAISFESTTKTQPSTVHHKKADTNLIVPTPILKTNDNTTVTPPSIINTSTTQELDEDNEAKIQAISNLRCPSPPPILNKTPESVSQPSVANTVSGTNPLKETPLLITSILVQSKPGSPRSVQQLQQQHQPSTTSMSLDDPLSSSSPAFTTPPSSQLVSSQTSIHNVPSHKEMVPAGGVYLKGRAAAQAVVAAVLAQTARNRNSNNNLYNSAVQLDEEELLSEVNLQINEQQFSHHKAPSMHAHFYLDETLKHGPRSRSGSGSTSESRNISEQLLSEASKKTGGYAAVSMNTVGSTINNNNNVLGQTPVVTKQTVDARLPSDDNKLHVLFGICGTVSTKKTRLIINKLEEIYGENKISVQIIITAAAEHFVSRGEFPSNVQIWRDKDEWTTWGGRSDPVLHIELRRWADILVIAPLTSNTLSKIALGLCDNLLTNVVRAWNTQYPILVAPSMVSYLYNSPVTKRHLKVIRDEMKWIEILKPTEKIVGSYGDIGMGGMMDWNEIVKTICLKAHELGFNDDEEDEDDDEEEDSRSKEEGNEEEEDGDAEEDVDDEDEEDEDEDDGIKISVAEEDEIEKVLKK